MVTVKPLGPSTRTGERLKRSHCLTLANEMCRLSGRVFRVRGDNRFVTLLEISEGRALEVSPHCRPKDLVLLMEFWINGYKSAREARDRG